MGVVSESPDTFVTVLGQMHSGSRRKGTPDVSGVLASGWKTPVNPTPWLFLEARGAAGSGCGSLAYDLQRCAARQMGSEQSSTRIEEAIPNHAFQFIQPTHAPASPPFPGGGSPLRGSGEPVPAARAGEPRHRLRAHGHAAAGDPPGAVGVCGGYVAGHDAGA